MIQKYISHVQKEREKEMRGPGGGQLSYKLPWKEEKKNPNYLRIRGRPSKSRIYALKDRSYAYQTSVTFIRISRTILP